MKNVRIALESYSMMICETLQTLSVIYFEFLFLQFFTMFTTLFLIYLLVYTSYYWISLLYMAWYIYDHNSMYTGGRINMYLRGLKIWKYYCQYFPMNLIKTDELNTDENYLFCFHPHGVMCFSGFGNFCTEGSSFSKLFPGIKPHVLMLRMLFFMPFTRELLLFTGASAVCETSFKSILNKKNQKGQAVIVVVGGAAER
jgi:hypothetical protein